MTKSNNFSTALPMQRRRFLQGTAATAIGGAFVSIGGVASAQGLTPVTVQYDWLMGNGQMGDIVAKQKGYFKEEGLDVTFSPGGPNAQTVPPVLTGQAQGGQLSSTSQLLTAIGAGRDIKLIAAGYRYSPYAYISLKKNPIRTAEDFVGKTIAMNPNGRLTLDIVLGIFGIDRDQVKSVTMGADMSPLLTGQVDAVTGFITNTKALSVLGDDIVTFQPAKDGGAYNYANAYFASSETYESQKDVLTNFIRAAAKGWDWAYNNRREAVDVMVEAYPQLDREVEYDTVDLIMSLSFNEETKEHGWGWFDSEKLAAQIEQFEGAGLFESRTPTVDNSATWEILDATAEVRPKLG